MSMRKTGQRPRFSLEAFAQPRMTEELGWKDLDSYGALTEGHRWEVIMDRVEQRIFAPFSGLWTSLSRQFPGSLRHYDSLKEPTPNPTSVKPGGKSKLSRLKEIVEHGVLSRIKTCQGLKFHAQVASFAC